MDVIYWINLQRSTTRRTQMQKMLTHHVFNDIPKIRMNAVDWKTLIKTDKFILPIRPETDDINNRVSVNEYACLLSHLETIREFSKSSHEIALVLEDDASLELFPYWDTINNVIKNAPLDWEIIKLFRHEIRENDTVYKKIIFPGFFKTRSTSTLAYIINKTAAKKLTDSLWNGTKFKLPYIMHIADFFLFMLCTTYDYKYPYFIPRKNNDSDIQVKYHQESANSTRRKIIALFKNKKHAVSMRKVKTRRNRKKKGGTRYYYPYNNNPLIFTNQSNRQQGGFDSRYSLLPSMLVDTARDIGYSMSSSNAEFNGNYPGVNPNWRFQPLK